MNAVVLKNIPEIECRDKNRITISHLFMGTIQKNYVLIDRHNNILLIIVASLKSGLHALVIRVKQIYSYLENLASPLDFAICYEPIVYVKL